MMRKNQSLHVTLVLLALVGLLAAPAPAEMLNSRTSQGNNVGLGFGLGWGGPLGSDNGPPSQFPKGSGNIIGFYTGGWTAIATRDRDGDGLAEDTVATVDGGRAMVSGHWSIEAADLIYGYALAGTDPNTKMGDIEHNQVWSSMDPENLQTWPMEAREGKQAGGDPVIKGKETVFVHYGDVRNAYTNPPVGWYSGLSFYFLDFGQSNDMVYGHVYWQNVSEYMKFNSSYSDIGDANPDGMTWQGLIIVKLFNDVSFGGQGAGWALHSEKGILTRYSPVPTISTFTPSEPPLWGVTMLKNPVWRGEEYGWTHFNTTMTNSEFGVSARREGAIMGGLPHSAKYRASKGEYDYSPGTTNPFTGEAGIKGWPGYLQPTDSRYSQWIWGGNGTRTTELYFSEMKDFAPRDTISWDYVYMYVAPGVIPMITPPYTLANIDDPMMQDAFAPMEDMSAAAQVVYDGGMKGPETPSPPPLTIIPGDRQVTITWSDINVTTPDNFYYALQETGADPEGLYREFDFEGYRLYRNFRGPNNIGAELIYDSSSEGVRFFHVDRLDDDIPYNRMRNGQKVWYALVPFDLNYSTSTGEAYSLPSTASSKLWNQPISRTGRTVDVLPRSDASNFNPAYVESVEFFQGTGTVAPTFSSTASLAGDGNGNLIDGPVYLAPVVDISVTPVNAEKLTEQKQVVLTTVENSYIRGGNYGRARINFQLTEGDFVSDLTQDTYIYAGSRPTNANEFDLNGKIDETGTAYALSASFQYLSPGFFRETMINIFDEGGYSGGTGAVYAGHPAVPQGLYAPSVGKFLRTGRYTVTWQTAPGGGLTVEVVDQTRGITLPYIEYIDDGYGWGLVLTEDIFGRDANYEGPGWNKSWNYVYTLPFWEAARDPVPRSERTYKFNQSLPADNTGEYGIWIAGQMLKIEGDDNDRVTMPSAGTVFTIDRAFGAWNEDRTVFTQYAEAPWPGDKWVAVIKPTTMNPEDADFSKIRVVPNPYVGSSFLDYSSSARRIEFVNLPARCTVRIYSLGGNLVNVLNHIGSNRVGWGNFTDRDNLSLGVAPTYAGFDNHSGTEPWNLRNRFGQTVASGLYFYHVTDERGKTHTGKFYVIN